MRIKKMPKAAHALHGEIKTAQLSAYLTPSGKLGLQELARKHQCSVNELLERIGQGMIALAAQEQEEILGKLPADR